MPRPEPLPARRAAPQASTEAPAGRAGGLTQQKDPHEQVVPFLVAAPVTVDSGVIQRETPGADARSPAEPRKGPVRTCIGCRKRELAVELLRVVAVGGGKDPGNGPCVVTVDVARKLPGRGAWLHPDPQCLNAALRRRAFGRALRITGSPDTTAVQEHLSAVRSAETPVASGNRTGSEEHEHTVKSR